MAIIRNYLNFLDYVDALLVESQFESASHKGKWVDHKAWLTSLYKIQNSSIDHKNIRQKAGKPPKIPNFVKITQNCLKKKLLMKDN